MNVSRNLQRHGQTELTVPLSVCLFSKWKGRLNQSGSSLVETLVLCTAMIPLALSLPMLGKLLDLRHTTQLASRYVAWEEAKGPAGDLHSRSAPAVGHRFFSSPDVAIETAVNNAPNVGLAAARGEVQAGTNELWGQNVARRNFTRNTAASNSQLWQGFGFQDVVRHQDDAFHVSVARSSLGGVAGSVSDSINAVGGLLNFAPGVEWDVESGDYVSGNIHAEAVVGSLLSGIGSGCGGGGGIEGTTGRVCFNEANAILTDTWSASSLAQVESRTKAFVPASVLEPVGRFISHFGTLPVVEELKDLEDAFGYVDATRLPEGRQLGSYPENGSP